MQHKVEICGVNTAKLPVLKEKGAIVAFGFDTRPDDPVSVKAIPYVDYGFFADDDKD